MKALTCLRSSKTCLVSSILFLLTCLMATRLPCVHGKRTVGKRFVFVMQENLAGEKIKKMKKMSADGSRVTYESGWEGFFFSLLQRNEKRMHLY